LPKEKLVLGAGSANTGKKYLENGAEQRPRIKKAGGKVTKKPERGFTAKETKKNPLIHLLSKKLKCYSKSTKNKDGQPLGKEEVKGTFSLRRGGEKGKNRSGFWLSTGLLGNYAKN